MTLGNFTTARPSLAVFLARTRFQVLPLSVERTIRTFLASFWVPLTFQVIVLLRRRLTEPPFSNELTRNGPAFSVDPERHVVVADAASAGDRVARGQPEVHRGRPRAGGADVPLDREELGVAVHDRDRHDDVLVRVVRRRLRAPAGLGVGVSVQDLGQVGEGRDGLVPAMFSPGAGLWEASSSETSA